MNEKFTNLEQLVVFFRPKLLLYQLRLQKLDGIAFNILNVKEHDNKRHHFGGKR
jgi:hypothetical protein